MAPIEDIFVNIFNFIGRLVCHQVPERTLVIGSHYLPVCARCTGTYLGFYVGYLLLPMRKKEAYGPPNLWVIFLMVTPMTIDVATQWFGFRTSANELRLMTGLLFGTALAPLLVYSISQIPTSRRIPVIRHFLPKSVRFDDKSSWLGCRALSLGLLTAVALFFSINSIVGSTNHFFYWSLSSLIISSVVLHIFFLPIFLAFSFLIYIRKRLNLPCSSK